MEASTFKLKTPHITGGRSHTPLAQTEHMTIGLNYYIPGRKNKLHTHPGEDHTFVVMDGQATFYNKDHQPTVLNKGEGIILPENHYYYFQSTDEGISGWGSCSGNGELIEFVVARILCPLIIGMDPTRIDDVWDQAYVRGGHKEFGTRGIGVVALSGIDVALWDILGKVRGLPLHQLLGGKCRDKVPVYATALYPEEPAKVAARARAFAE